VSGATVAVQFSPDMPYTDQRTKGAEGICEIPHFSGSPENQAQERHSACPLCAQHSDAAGERSFWEEGNEISKGS